jgi:cytochrome bd ubiquinol oxidase subunit II
VINFWVCVLALTIFLYVTLDGFDLGVGMLMPFAGDGQSKRHMLAAIAPVWDGNETWLVLNATVLFGIFPLTYATLLSAFYLPLMVMLGALILRGVAFEFRERSKGGKGFWDAAFIGGSYVATFMQGAAIGALVSGLPMRGLHYVGGPFGWLSPFSLLCGVGLCLGYAMLGAGWLTYKSTQEVQDFAFRALPWLMMGVLAFLALAFARALSLRLNVMDRWFERPIMLILPAIGVLAGLALCFSVRRRRELLPFLCGLVVFAAALGTLSLSFYPYMIPFAITTTQAAAPASSQAFLFWGAGVFVLPLTLIYTMVIYFIFKGKVGQKTG